MDKHITARKLQYNNVMLVYISMKNLIGNFVPTNLSVIHFIFTTYTFFSAVQDQYKCLYRVLKLVYDSQNVYGNVTDVSGASEI